MLATVASDWRRYGDADDALCSMVNVAGLSHRFANLIVGLHSMAVLFYGIGVVALRSGDADGDRELFLKMELPFESGASPVYELVMATQFLHQMTAATVIGVLSALLVTLVSRDNPRKGGFSSSSSRSPLRPFRFFFFGEIRRGLSSSLRARESREIVTRLRAAIPLTAKAARDTFQLARRKFREKNLSERERSRVKARADSSELLKQDSMLR